MGETLSAGASEIVPAALKHAFADGCEIAVLDVREQGEFADGHLFLAVPAPYSRFEAELLRLVPRKGTRIVLCDEGTSGRAQRARQRAEALGYQNVLVLKGGTSRWRDAGFQLFQGVNVPSKTFGEIVERACHTPGISASELEAMRKRGEPVLILDGRPFEEHRKMNIPGSICLPNGDLAYRIESILEDKSRPIVVHCAGRTRSIIGAQTLRNLGIENPVFALENGTQGWMLSGLALE